MPKTDYEFHHFGWNRCSSARHGPDRNSVGERSSTRSPSPRTDLGASQEIRELAEVRNDVRLRAQWARWLIPNLWP
jgi:hypothetical protein